MSRDSKPTALTPRPRRSMHPTPDNATVVAADAAGQTTDTGRAQPTEPPDKPPGVAACLGHEQPVPDQLPLRTPPQAAQLLAVPESWLRRKAAARAIPCTFLGKHLRFSPADLATIVTAAAQPPRTRPRATQIRPGRQPVSRPPSPRRR